MSKALILVDLQNDFCPGGALAVANGDETIAVANKLSRSGNFDVVVATQDWHPADHKSFRSNNDVPDDEIVGTLNGVPQVWWPDHCVQGSMGAEFHKDVDTSVLTKVFQKGSNSNVDSYSGFFDNKAIIDGQEVRSPTGLEDYLKQAGVTEVYVLGLATDYCVKFTVLDALSCGFNTSVVVDGCRAVNLNEGDDNVAIEEMQNAGATLVNSSDL